MVNLWHLAGLAVLLISQMPAPAQADDPPPAPPARVVSINTCTDQLAMLLATPSQLRSVSHLAQDPRVSAMAEEATAYPANHARAEEIYLMRPDLVLAGTYSSRATVEMLRRLDVPVIEFDPAASLEDVRQLITKMGAALHQQDRAAQMRADFDAQLAALTPKDPHRPRVVLYYANSYTASDGTLAGEMLRAAGFDNAADAFATGSKLPLELLALTDPDAVITAQPYPGTSRAEAVMDHPVVDALRAGRGQTRVADQDWICGTPYVLRAIENLATLRQDLSTPQETHP